jgi:hypothetical protein
MSKRPTKERLEKIREDAKYYDSLDLRNQLLAEIDTLIMEQRFFKELIAYLDKIDAFWILKEAHDDGYISEDTTSYEELMDFRDKVKLMLKRLSEESNG